MHGFEPFSDFADRLPLVLAAERAVARVPADSHQLFMEGIRQTDDLVHLAAIALFEPGLEHIFKGNPHPAFDAQLHKGLPVFTVKGLAFLG